MTSASRRWWVGMVMVTTSALPGAAAWATDWSQPPVACVEEVVPTMGDRPCLDLSSVANVYEDWPSDLSAADLAYWQGQKRPIEYCRAHELLRRESQHPGTYTPGQLEDAWMKDIAVESSDIKIKAVYHASRAYHVPAQVLTGALYQESMFSQLGIAEDGGNYSCGVGQVNLLEWCRWANTEPAAEKTKMGWPQAVECSSLDPVLLKPFYEIAKTRLNGEPEYKLLKTHFAGIQLKDVVSGFPAGDADTQSLRYSVARSFIENCSDPAYGIHAKAHELAGLYSDVIPAGLKSRDLYAPGQHFERACREQGEPSAYPLSLGWLLAVGAYNSGPRAVDAVAYYNRWNGQDVQAPATWAGFSPQDLIASLFWAGKYNPKTDKLEFETLSGEKAGFIWFKTCVLQRHIARVIQHVTRIDAPSLAHSLENGYKCTKSKFDPQGHLLETAVPPFRQASQGHK